MIWCWYMGLSETWGIYILPKWLFKRGNGELPVDLGVLYVQEAICSIISMMIRIQTFCNSAVAIALMPEVKTGTRILHREVFSLPFFVCQTGRLDDEFRTPTAQHDAPWPRWQVEQPKPFILHRRTGAGAGWWSVGKKRYGVWAWAQFQLGFLS